ncbi:MAG: calcineurin, partial [Oscillospiraceae bacterium]|nr:calcineurin [Oscillospiraceae bacterium]
ARPSLNDRYFADKTVIFGHTPSHYFGSEYQGRAVKTDTWLCIDTGAAGGGSPMLYCLDNQKEYYIE